MCRRDSHTHSKHLHLAAGLALLALGLQFAWVAILSVHERWELDSQRASAAVTSSESSKNSAPFGSPHHDHTTCHVCQVLAQVRVGTIIAVFLLLVSPGIVPAVSFAAQTARPYIAPILSCAASPRAPPLA